MGTAIRLIDPAENDILAQLEKRSGKPNNFFRTMANRPEVLKNFTALYGAIMGPGSVDRRTKELVYLSVSFANECAYCSAAHTATAHKAGILEDELPALRTEQDPPFSAQERAVLQYARELTRTADARDTRDALYEYFSSEQIVEITLIVALANFTNRFNSGLEVQPEE
jgi:uncharacterized peroxidase-related enzyme